MEEAPRVASRRGVLARGGWFLAGLLGGAAVGRAGPAGAAPPQPAGRPANPGTTTLTLHARHLQLRAPEHRAGRMPVGGDRHSAYGELLDRPSGKVVGHITAAHLTQDSPFSAGLGSLEIHTFHLGDGTIHGLGTATPGAIGHFVVLGGTGAYAGASGSYTARQRPREHGGNGTADFDLRLAT
jgi:hypothetical protein